MGRKDPKVAYVVLKGRQPGVYHTWTEAEAQVNSFPRAIHRGFTAAQGGEQAAHRAWQKHRESEGYIEADKTQASWNAKPPVGLAAGPTLVSKSQYQGHKETDCLMGARNFSNASAAADVFPPNRHLSSKRKSKALSWDMADPTSTKVAHKDQSADVHYPMSIAAASGSEFYTGVRRDETGQCIVHTAGRLTPANHVLGMKQVQVSEPQSPSSSSSHESTQCSLFSSHEEEGMTQQEIDAMNFPALTTASQRFNAMLKRLDHCVVHNLPFSPRLTSMLHEPPPVIASSVFDHKEPSPAPDYIDLTQYDDAHPQQLVSRDQHDIAPPPLSKEQSSLVDLMMKGGNVFFTGSAGTGKSTTLHHFIRQKKSAGVQVDIIAPTGRAALAIGGTTLWSYAGWTPDSMKLSLHDLEARSHGKLIYKRLKKTNILVIDEISMVENIVFKRLNIVMKAIRGSTSAFGGVQVIATGDFHQLPPVQPFRTCLYCGKEDPRKFYDEDVGEELIECTCGRLFAAVDKWAFSSSAWQQCNFRHIILSQIHRQSDTTFIDILQTCRLGNPLTTAQQDILLHHQANTENATKLFPQKGQVASLNMKEFKRLETAIFKYQAYDGYHWREEQHPNLSDKFRRNHDGSLKDFSDHPMDYDLLLREGMLILLIANLSIPAGLVNGSQGIIVGFEEHREDRIPDETGDYSIERTDSIKAYLEKSKPTHWPIVQFSSGIRRTIYPHCRLHELGHPPPYSSRSRTQIPLMPGWALTVHKAQGMTLNRVIVDLAKSFAEGQAYVALSRATSLEGLTVRSLEEKPISANAEVKKFMAAIEEQMRERENGSLLT